MDSAPTVGADESRTQTIDILSVGLALIVALSFALAVRFNWDFLQLLEIGVSSLLTVTLVYIYANQNDILRDQTTLQQQQTSLLEGTPILATDVRDYSLQDEDPFGLDDYAYTDFEDDTDDYPDGDFIQIDIENVGDSRAVDVNLYCLISYNQPDDHSFVYRTATAPLELQTLSTQTSEDRGVVIPSGTQVAMRGDVTFEKVYQNDHTTSVNCVRTIRELLYGPHPKRETTFSPVEYVKIGFVVVFTSLNNGPHTLKIRDGLIIRGEQFESRDDITMQSIQNNGTYCSIQKLIDESGWSPLSNETE